MELPRDLPGFFYEPKFELSLMFIRSEKYKVLVKVM